MIFGTLPSHSRLIFAAAAIAVLLVSAAPRSRPPRGETAIVKVSSDTRFRRDRKEAHLADFKVGETVMILGEQHTSGCASPADSALERSD